MTGDFVTPTAAVLEEVAAERRRQRDKWGDRHDDECGGWRHLADLIETWAWHAEYQGMVADRTGTLTPTAPSETGRPRTPRELFVGIAAMAVAGVEAWDREAALDDERRQPGETGE